MDGPSGSGARAFRPARGRSLVCVRLALFAAFVLSGLSALIYESLWARYLGLFVGHAAYAQILVLAIFLGGMSIGALLAASRSGRLEDPLQWYARAELLIGVLGFGFHQIHGAATGAAYEWLFPALHGQLALQALKWGLAAALILPQSVLLGATFPLMSAGFMRRFPDRPGRSLSILYFANSAGAAGGVLLAGFWLLPLAGLPGTLVVAAVINWAVALLALAVCALHPAPRAAGAPSPSEPGHPPALGTASGGLERLLLVVAFGTAVASFIYEVAWIRMLSLVLGSATHSFELMLSAFILGLALGSLWVRSRTDRWANLEGALGVVQWVMGAAALATLPLYASSFHWMALLLETFARTEAGYVGFSLARYAICLAIMLPATFCAGITLPLITRALIARSGGEAAIGRVYGVNTLGSIVGVVAAGLALIPTLGLRGTLVLGATLDMALGAAVLLAAARRDPAARRRAHGFAAATALLAIVSILPGRFDPRLLGSGVYRRVAIDSLEQFQSLFHEDGRTSTVSALRHVESGHVRISTNGKPEASLPGFWFEGCSDALPRQPLFEDAATQALAPLITLAHAPRSRRAAVIGHGSGLSAHFVLGSPKIESLVSVEIEPAVVRGSRVFLPHNRRVFDDPRSRIAIDDAKSYFAASNQRFDLIFSEPSNPWVSGVASLFSVEFYTRIRDYLSEEGVFGQWLHLYEIDDRMVLSILAAVHVAFPSYEVFLTNSADVVIVATGRSELPPPDWSVLSLSALARDLCRHHPLTPRMLEATRLTHREALAPLLDGWEQPNSDFYPIVDLGAERARYLGRGAPGLPSLHAARFDISAPFFDRASPPADERSAPVLDIPRMRALAVGARLRQPADAGEEPDPAAARAGYALSQWRAVLSRGEAPADWRSWLQTMRAVEGSVHGGVHGFADPDFYGAVARFLEEAAAPQPVRDVVDFRRALAAWNFSRAAAVGERLLPGVVERRRLIPAGEYLDGAVVAKLRVGDPAGAQRIFDAVGPLSGRLPTDLRLALLRAYVDAAVAGRDVAAHWSHAMRRAGTAAAPAGNQLSPESFRGDGPKP